MLRAERGRMLAARMPRDGVLTESDGPFAQGDGRPLVPSDVNLAGRELGKIWGADEQETNATLLDNLRRLVID
jgi:TatD DNase family protein